MKQYNLLYHMNSEFFLAEGLPDSGCVYDPRRREVFGNEKDLLDYISAIPKNKKVQFNLDKSVPKNLGGIIANIHPKSLIETTELRRPSRD